MCRSDARDTQPPSDASESLSLQLDSWKIKLDEIIVQCTSQADHDTVELPLRAYLGFDDRDDPGWKVAVLARAKALAREAAVLYHLLSLQLHISKHPRLSELLLSDSGIQPITSEMHMDWVSTWRQSKDARKTLAHSVAVTRTLELALFQDSSSRDIFMPSPITSLAFLISRNILRLWCASPEGACTCDAQEPHTDIDLNSSGLYRGAELQPWFDNGGPPKVNGVPFCKCAGEMWFMRVEPLL